MLIEFIAYSLIACQIDLVLCRPQSQNFNGSNPYYNSNNNNPYWGDYNANSYITTQKSLYPILYPQAQPTYPPYYGQGQYSPNPQTSTSLNKNSSIPTIRNTFGGNYSSFGWNSNFNPQTTSSSYQPYKQIITTTMKPPITTLPPFMSGSFNQYNRHNRTNPTLPSNIPQTTFSFGHNNVTYYHNNTLRNKNWSKNNTTNQYPVFPQSTIHTGQRTNNNNFFSSVNTNQTNYNNYPSYRPSAPPLQGNVFPTSPTYDQNGTPLAPLQSFHANAPINEELFNYNNLHGRRPNYGMESASDSSNVPLAPFPDSGITYGINSYANVPLAPFNSSRGTRYGDDSNRSAPLASYPSRG